MLPTREQRALWRIEFEMHSFTSSIGEYCPKEFGYLLDAVDELEYQNAELRRKLEVLEGVGADGQKSGIRVFPGQKERVETGPVQFGEDWPGLFIRGDQAGSLALALRHLLGENHDPALMFALFQVRELQQLLASAVIGPAGPLLTDEANPKLGPAPEILPCPFCGQIPDINNPGTFVSDQGDKWGHVVCCCTGPEVRTDYQPLEHWMQAAIDAWNERAKS